jgi:hypothetical protein
MINHGMTSWDASRKALAVLEFTVRRQSDFLSYIDAFRGVSIVSVVCVPIIFFAGKTKKVTPAKVAAAASESH